MGHAFHNPQTLNLNFLAVSASWRFSFSPYHQRKKSASIEALLCSACFCGAASAAPFVAPSFGPVFVARAGNRDVDALHRGLRASLAEWLLFLLRPVLVARYRRAGVAQAARVGGGAGTLAKSLAHGFRALRGER